MSYNIAVIGPIPRDRITTYKGEVFEKYGCVTHPVIAISKLLDAMTIVSIIDEILLNYLKQKLQFL